MNLFIKLILSLPFFSLLAFIFSFVAEIKEVESLNNLSEIITIITIAPLMFSAFLFALKIKHDCK